MGKVIALRSSAKALIVRRDGDRFRLELSPVANRREKDVFIHFDDAAAAVTYARRLTLLFGDLYRSVIDQTGEAA
jgi:hypothetical protein